MPLIPSLRRALARLIGGPDERGGRNGREESSRPATSPSSFVPPASAASPSSPSSPGFLIPLGHHVVFATSAREAERALVLMMEGAAEDLRRACGRALRDIRAQVEEAPA